MEKVRVLLAGTGGYGANYFRILLEGKDNGVEFAGVADPFASASPLFEELKKRSIPIFKNPDEFFAHNKADLTVVSSPIHTHYPYTLTAFRNGSSVLCEKPFNGSMAELDELIGEEKKTGLFCAIGFQHCYSTGMQELKKDILGGLLGKPLEFKSINLPRRGTRYYQRNKWVGRINFENMVILDSPLQNACSHELLNMLFLLGSEMNRSITPDSVEAELWQGRQEIENYDAAAVRVKTGGGVKVHFYTAHCIDEARTGPIGEYRFEKATVIQEPPEGSIFTARFNDGTVKKYEGIVRGSQFKKFPDAVQAVRTGVPPICTLETARPHLQCVTMIQKFPIQKVQPEKLGQGTSDDGDIFFYIPGLREAFLSAYEKSALPGEIGFKVK